MPETFVLTTGSRHAMASVITVGRMSQAPLLIHDARQHENVRLRQLALDLPLAADTKKRNVQQAVGRDQLLQFPARRSLADDARLDRHATPVQLSNGIKQNRDALELDQPPHADDAQRAAALRAARRESRPVRCRCRCA